MPTFYNYTQDGQIYSFDDVFVPADAFRQGNLWTWGDNTNGQLGNNTNIANNIPFQIFRGGTNWNQFSFGNRLGTAIKTDGTLWVWGDGQSGQLGNNARPVIITTPVTTFAGGTNWKQVSSGNSHATAIKTDGTLWTWGSNFRGAIGDNTTTTRCTPVTTFAGGTNWKQVSGGNGCTTAIKTDGTLWAWGINSNGQLGDNTTISRCTPVTTFAGGTNWKSVFSGYRHITAIKTDGTLWVWGQNYYTQLGFSYINNRVTPVTTFAGGTNWAVIAKGDSVQSFDYSTLETGIATKTDGTLWVWGRTGVLPQTSQNLTPVTTFAGGTDWKSVSSSGVSVAAIKTDGTLWTWSDSTFRGQQGNNQIQYMSTPVTTFAGGTNWKQISCSTSHIAAIKTDGTLWIWGQNNSNNIGANNVVVNSWCTPITTFAGGTNWKQVSCGSVVTAAIKTDGTLWTWGNNSSGQLGRNEPVNPRTPSTTFAGGTNWSQVSCGDAGMAAIKTDGTLWTWGNNSYGGIGDNTTTTRSTPVTTFAGGTNWKQVSCGVYYTTAIKTDGTLWAWGGIKNAFAPEIGELGNNVVTGSCTPVTTFAGGTDWALVSSKRSYNYSSISAIKTDGTLWTWGNDLSILGINIDSTRDTYTPVTTFAGGTNWKQSSGGKRHTAAIKTDGTLWTWGNNYSGQLGDNTRINRSTPVTTFAGGNNWKQISCGGYHTTAINTNGTLWTWGFNGSGQLGDNTNTNRCTPVTTFAGGTNWKQVACEGSNTGAIIYDDPIFPT
jgi:alpha-tubulin suppressor-like RCC1 family protein